MSLKKYLVKLIDFYQKYLSPLKKPSCVFYPTCSTYAKEAIEKYGAFKGLYLSFRRILRCHPWQTPKVDLLE